MLLKPQVLAAATAAAAAQWYHVVSGQKVFLAAPPTPGNLDGANTRSRLQCHALSLHSIAHRNIAQLRAADSRKALTMPVPPSKLAPCPPAPNCLQPSSPGAAARRSAPRPWPTCSPAACACGWALATLCSCPGAGPTRCPPRRIRLSTVSRLAGPGEAALARACQGHCGCWPGPAPAPPLLLRLPNASPLFPLGLAPAGGNFLHALDLGIVAGVYRREQRLGIRAKVDPGAAAKPGLVASPPPLSGL